MTPYTATEGVFSDWTHDSKRRRAASGDDASLREQFDFPRQRYQWRIETVWMGLMAALVGAGFLAWWMTPVAPYL
jgi:hypothetical protein